MSQHVSETCDEGNGFWLPIIEYSVKSGVSLSTIRRKIKTNSIQYRLEKGRYLIWFNHMNHPTSYKPSASVKEFQGRYPEEAPVRRQPPTPPRETPKEDDRWTLPLVEKSVRMVSDAFEHALKEKDERIRLLEQRNNDLAERLNELRLLVHVLEEKYEVRY